jgi:hypothetical protein
MLDPEVNALIARVQATQAIRHGAAIPRVASRNFVSCATTSWSSVYRSVPDGGKPALVGDGRLRPRADPYGSPTAIPEGPTFGAPALNV